MHEEKHHLVSKRAARWRGVLLRASFASAVPLDCKAGRVEYLVSRGRDPVF